jgi:hypothetical protein
LSAMPGIHVYPSLLKPTPPFSATTPHSFEIRSGIDYSLR